MEEQKKVIQVLGKEINYGKMSDEKLLKFYRELKERELIYYKRIINASRKK